MFQGGVLELGISCDKFGIKRLTKNLSWSILITVQIKHWGSFLQPLYGWAKAPRSRTLRPFDLNTQTDLGAFCYANHTSI